MSKNLLHMKFTRLVLTVIILFCTNWSFAQHLPGEKSVRKGALDNGLTYYIVHNELPPQRAEFYLATNVGAIQETPEQDGLAHFLEHMCFNGTKNFPGKGILDYLQSIGARFGVNVNASTGVEETIYMLNNIPLVNASVVDSCLLILHDYSHFVTCSPEEIDKERGVILEERRSRRDAAWRLNEQAKPFLFGETKYAGCSIIGSEENLKSFKPGSLVDFYATWYRPDLQAVIVVGDVDVDEVESKIASIWSDVPIEVKTREKESITIPVNETPVIGILTDPEQANTNLAFFWRKSVSSEENNDTAPNVVESLLKQIVVIGMQERLSDIATKAESPFTLASFSTMNLCETLDASALIVIPKDGQWVPSVAVAFTEAEKLQRFGLLDSEIERAKSEVLSRYEAAAAKAGTRKNSDFVGPLINNFFDNHEYMAPSDKFSLVKGILPQLSAAMINQMASNMITDENLVVLYYGTEKEDIVHPTREQISEILSDVKSSDLRQNAEREVATTFVNPQELGGSVIKKTALAVQNAVQWTLKNGARVVLLPTECEKDKVIIKLVKKGGRSLIATEDLTSFEENICTIFQMNQGVAEFSAPEVKKMLSGKVVSSQPYIKNYTHGIAASSTAKDLETAFQLVYLQFCKPRFDQSEFSQSIQMIEPIIDNLDNMPQFLFQKEALKTLYDSTRHPLLSRDVLSFASLQTMERVYEGLFNDAADLCTIIVGDFDLDSIKPLVEKYIGSIPKGRKASKWANDGNKILGGEREKDFCIKITTPKVTVSQIYTIDKPYSAKWDASLDALEYILKMIYTETLREDEGGTYGAQVSCLAGVDPSNQSILEVDFETNPESADKLRGLAKDGLKTIATNGPQADQFDKALKNLQKKIPENRLKNNYWLNGLDFWCTYRTDYITEYEQAVNTLTAKDVQSAAEELLHSGNFAELVMRPENKND